MAPVRSSSHCRALAACILNARPESAEYGRATAAGRMGGTCTIEGSFHGKLPALGALSVPSVPFTTSMGTAAVFGRLRAVRPSVAAAATVEMRGMLPRCRLVAARAHIV